MSIDSRLRRLERRRGEDAGRVRFIVRVPPKMTREEWRQHVREWQHTRERVFTVDLDGAGVFGGDDE